MRSVEHDERGKPRCFVMHACALVRHRSCYRVGLIHARGTNKPVRKLGSPRTLFKWKLFNAIIIHYWRTWPCNPYFMKFRHWTGTIRVKGLCLVIILSYKTSYEQIQATAMKRLVVSLNMLSSYLYDYNLKTKDKFLVLFTTSISIWKYQVMYLQ